MKKIILFSMAMIMFCTQSCQKSPEAKAESLIENTLKKNLYHPESYEAVETQLDSAFTPLDDPRFYEKTLKLAIYDQEAVKLDKDLKEAKSSMAIFSDRYSEYSRNEYQEAKEKYEKKQAELETIKDKAEKLIDEIRAETQKSPSFIGFKAKHKYRANNNAGNTMFGMQLFLFDKEISSIITSYDMDAEEYQLVQQWYKLMMGGD